MTISIMFWNVWLDNQIDGPNNSDKLLKELKRLVELYNPDLIGLNEVMQSTKSTKPFLTVFLKEECGYNFSHFAVASPQSDEWLIGTALYSRIKFNSVTEIPISDDVPAKKRGYIGHKLKAVAASISIPNNDDLNIIVAHPLHLTKSNLKAHYEATSKLEELVRSKAYSHHTVLGGDFNESQFMPNSFKNNVKDIMYSKTGSILKPTWRHNASIYTPLRANLDQVYWSKNSYFNLKRFTVIDSGVSDHRPLFIELEY